MNIPSDNTTTLAQTPQDTSAEGQNAAGFAIPEKPSVGEKWWHRITYGGVGYAANLLLSLVIWDFMREGGGRPLLNKIAQGGAALLKGGGMKPDAAIKTAAVAADMAMSPLGGHVTMIPVKILEEHAGGLTHGFNKMLDPNYQYKDLQVPGNAEDGDFPPLAHPPNHNTWGQIALRRGLGWTAVTLSGVALNKSGFQEPLQNNTLRFFNKAVDATGSGALRRFANIPRIQRYTRLAALDAYFTVITSAITEMTKATFGQSRNHRDEMAEEALSVEIPGITEDVKSKGGQKARRAQQQPVTETSHVARLKEKPAKNNALIPQENFVKALQADRDASSPDHTLSA